MAGKALWIYIQIIFAENIQQGELQLTIHNYIKDKIMLSPEEKQAKEDIAEIIRYVKVDLYPKVKFVYSEKEDLKVHGLIYNNYKEKCKNSIGVHSLNEVGHRTYMELIWQKALGSHTQIIALSQKRSAVYTVMQNKFSGK